MKLIGLDVGEKRIGVAKADTSTRIAIPDCVVVVNGQEFSEIARIARTYGTKNFVVGLPRSNEGRETAQSAYVRRFANTLKQTIPGSKIYFQDESLTSVEAESRLKSRKKSYKKGDIDTEAAAIILQDCIESFASRATGRPTPATTPKVTTTPKSDIGDIWAGTEEKSTPAKNVKRRRNLQKTSKTGKTLGIIALVLVILLGGGFLIVKHWYNDQLRPVQAGVDCSLYESAGTAPEDLPEGCQNVKFTIGEDASLSVISDHLEGQDLIRSALAFRLYARFSGHANDLKAGQYTLKSSMSVSEIVDLMVKGDVSGNVFKFTILPGETIASIKKKLLAEGYSEGDVEAAFKKDYSGEEKLKTLLSSKPADASLEGYLYGETYEFYNDEKVENILIRTMEELAKVVDENGLVAAYEAQGLNLHEGLTLASIVQKEAHDADQAGVARVFLNRLGQGIMLGSDVTAKYAADLIDPERKEYTDNAAVLAIDSPFNTRKNAGLPPTPISSPGLSALLAVAHPADSDYLYFLTGDDGVVYYSNTEEEHLENASAHCQELCNVEL